VSTSRKVSRTLVRRGAVAVVVAGCAGALLVGAGAMPRGPAPDAAVDLADARPYAVLAGGTVTGAGTSSITGDVGGSTVGGLDGAATGTVRTGGATAEALADLGGADDTVAARRVTAALRRVGGTLGPGTYGISGAIDVRGVLTLDAGGDADATFVLKTDSGFTAGDGTAVVLAGGARACNVFWLAGGSATVDGTVVGTVFARSGVTVRSGATVTGRLLSRSGTVRLEDATVRVPTDCDGPPPTAGSAGPADDRPGEGAPEPLPPGAAEIVTAPGAGRPAGTGAGGTGRDADRGAAGAAGGGVGGARPGGGTPAEPGAGRTRATPPAAGADRPGRPGQGGTAAGGSGASGSGTGGSGTGGSGTGGSGTGTAGAAPTGGSRGPAAADRDDRRGVVVTVPGAGSAGVEGVEGLAGLDRAGDNDGAGDTGGPAGSGGRGGREGRGD
jgi:hypothetical protein